MLKESGLNLSHWTQAIDQAKKMNIPPISGNVGHGNGQYFLQTSIPVKTIRAIVELGSAAYISHSWKLKL